MVLFAMFDIGGTVPVALAALLADEGLVVTGRLGGVLQGCVALEQPGGREGGEADPAAAPLGVQQVSVVVHHAVVAEVAPQPTRLQGQQGRPQRQRGGAARRDRARYARGHARHVQAHLECNMETYYNK